MNYLQFFRNWQAIELGFISLDLNYFLSFLTLLKSKDNILLVCCRYSFYCKPKKSFIMLSLLYFLFETVHFLKGWSITEHIFFSQLLGPTILF